jgi:hypothetical protein
MRQADAKMSLQDAAVFLASQWPVFPCNALKRPVVENGFYAATKDVEAARALFRRPGAALIGVPTGAGSDLVVVDFDIKRGVDGLAFLRDNEHRLPRTRRHRTASGGVHLLFRHPGGIIRNSAGALAPGVDVRGDGGYIIVPPSEGYEITDEAMPADMPGWLVAAMMSIRPKLEPVAPATYEPRPLLTNDGTPWGLGALRRACDAIRNAPEGAKHDTLNREAYSIGGLVTGGDLLEAPARAALADALGAIRHRCDDFRAAERTLMQAFASGMEKPRQPPPAMPARREPFADAFARVARDDSGTTYDAETGEIIDAPPRAAAAQPAARSFELVWFDDITPCLDAQDFVQGVLIENSAAVVYGESNAGKTFWTTDLALHVAAGKTWNGRRVEQGGVVYCVLEGGVGFRNRVTAWRGTHQPDKPVHFAAIQAGMNLLLPDADTPKLIAAIKEAAERIGAPVKLIVIDTLSRAFAGGNENASEDMGLLVQNMDAIRRETGACVLFVHHSGKDQAKGARGHSLLRAAIDTEIEVKATEDSPVKTATTVKQREVKKGEVFHFQLEVVELGQNRHGEPVTTCVVDAPSAEDIAQAEASGGDRLSGDQAAALRVLTNLLAASGMVSPHPDMPDNVRSVPEAWWADRFKTEAKPGASDEAKRKAFRRSADKLLHIGKIGQANGRVWLV